MEFVAPRDQLEALDRMAAALDRAEALGEHLWVAAVAYLVHPPMPEGYTLSARDLAGPPSVGCFRCEQSWDPWLAAGVCPGDPP
jgi:hypothetical protein